MTLFFFGVFYSHACKRTLSRPYKKEDGITIVYDVKQNPSVAELTNQLGSKSNKHVNFFKMKGRTSKKTKWLRKPTDRWALPFAVVPMRPSRCPVRRLSNVWGIERRGAQTTNESDYDERLHTHFPDGKKEKTTRAFIGRGRSLFFN